ncbi:MAG: protein phosphatase 2C domain-containing protein [Anaerolineae bacterium]|nr:protein phosphatase 2C domain-containing protein [Anaerolineae bacterium]
MAYRLNTATATHPGKKNKVNEDAVFASSHPDGPEGPVGLLVVSDGIGGRKAGGTASQMAIEIIHSDVLSYVSTKKPSKSSLIPNFFVRNKRDRQIINLSDMLRRAIEKANTAIYAYAQNNQEEAGNLGCTLTCVLVENNIAIIGNVGDSRAYHLHNKQLMKITDDHSVVGELVRRGILPEDAYYDNPHRRIITRSLGNKPEIEVDIWTRTLSGFDRLLLCTDGLWEMIPDHDRLTQLIQSSSRLPKVGKKLIDEAKKNGARDNISVALGEIVIG